MAAFIEGNRTHDPIVVPGDIMTATQIYVQHNITARTYLTTNNGYQIWP